jgi:hypothetical protein
LQAPKKQSVTPDVLVNNVGTLYTFCPLTLRAKEWIDEHVQDDAQWFGRKLWALARISACTSRSITYWGMATSLSGHGSRF